MDESMAYIDTRTIGTKLRQIRYSRKKSLEVIAGLAGISRSQLSDLERGLRPPSLKQLVDLSNALEIAPSELTKLPVPPPANGNTDSTTEAVRIAFDAVDTGRPDGRVLPTGILWDQVRRLHEWRRACRFAEVASELPELVRDAHTTLNAGVDRGALSALVVYLHVHVTRMWLVHACAPTDLIRRCVFLTKRVGEASDDSEALAVSSLAVADALAMSGSFSMAEEELNGISLPAVTRGTAGFLGYATLCRAVTAYQSGRLGDMVAAIEEATDLAGRFGDVYSWGFLVHPVDVVVFRMWIAMEDNDPDETLVIGRQVDPETHPSVTIRTAWWANCGRALAQVRGREAEAVTALRTAEDLFPTMVHREPLIRDALSGLVTKSRRDSVGRELRGLAYRSGLPV